MKFSQSQIRHQIVSVSDLKIHMRDKMDQYHMNEERRNIKYHPIDIDYTVLQP